MSYNAKKDFPWFLWSTVAMLILLPGLVQLTLGCRAKPAAAFSTERFGVQSVVYPDLARVFVVRDREHGMEYIVFTDLNADSGSTVVLDKWSL